jgi:hypothetical protein
LNKLRKFLIALALILVTANVGFIYVKTRPMKPDVIFDFTGNYAVESWDTSALISNAIYLQSGGQWTLRNGNEVDPVKAASLTIPNIDSPEYWVLVDAPQAFTFGYAIEALRSLAKLGICNVVFLANSRPEEEGMQSSSVLSLDGISEANSKPMKKCQDSELIEQRYNNAAAEYERTRKRPAILEW